MLAPGAPGALHAKGRSPRSSACARSSPNAGLAKLDHRTDKREQAQEHLTSATAMYREMGMTFWLEKAEAELT